jgi:hypothetical protein
LKATEYRLVMSFLDLIDVQRPAERHHGAGRSIFARRIAIYEQARAKNPARWRSHS